MIKDIQKAIEYKIETGSNEKFTEELIKNMKELHSEWSFNEDDYRNGEDTYGYIDDVHIENTLKYISDRWRCAFRLKWLIDGIGKQVI